jgi:hypothetical protein
MEKNKDTNFRKNHIEEIKEWQEHQYDPGYYTGGRIPPIGRPAILGWFWVISSLVFFIILSFIYIVNIKEDYAIILIVLLFINLFQFYLGMRLIKKGKGIEYYAKVKKIFIIISCSIVVAVTLFTFINSAYLIKEDFIIINDVESIELKQEYDKNYIILYDGELLLKCDSAGYYDIWSVKVTNGKAAFRIRYKWNILNEGNGRVINVERLE